MANISPLLIPGNVCKSIQNPYPSLAQSKSKAIAELFGVQAWFWPLLRGYKLIFFPNFSDDL